MSLSNTTNSTTTQNSAQPSIKDERGNISLVSNQFGVGIKIIAAGIMTLPDGKEKPYPESIKIVSGDNVIKFTALQFDYLRLAFNHPEVIAEVTKRKTAELEKLMKELQG